jgi:hypothetical protein
MHCIKYADFLEVSNECASLLLLSQKKRANDWNWCSALKMQMQMIWVLHFLPMATAAASLPIFNRDARYANSFDGWVNKSVLSHYVAEGSSCDRIPLTFVSTTPAEYEIWAINRRVFPFSRRERKCCDQQNHRQNALILLSKPPPFIFKMITWKIFGLSFAQ